VLTEGALLTTLAHPHLVRGYEVVTAPRPAVVLETLPGATLAALIDDRRLGGSDAALLGRQLASVLGYLHRQGWVHLDVKPGNVVVQEGRAVLIDLGLATRPGRIERGMGTDCYAAPEQDAGVGSRLVGGCDQQNDHGGNGDQHRQAQQAGSDDPADPAGVRGRPTADLAVAGVDLGDHPVAHDPGDRGDHLAGHQPEDPEDQHQHRLLVVLWREPAVRRRAVLVRGVVRRLAGRRRRRLRHGDILPPPTP
jgi:Protein kinase domain